MAKYIERWESPGSLSELYYEARITAAAEKIAQRNRRRSPRECTNLLWTDWA